MFTNRDTYEYISEMINDKIMEWKNCLWTGKEFPIFESEKATLESISPIINWKKYDISLPNLCPEARQIHRMLFRNDRSFYKTKDDLYNKDIISIYYDSFPWKVYEVNSWYKDMDASKYSLDFEDKDSILKKMQELTLSVPRLNVDGIWNENSNYCNYCGYCKNCYLDIAWENNEDCYYCTFTKYSKRCVDCTFVYNSEWCYETLNTYESNSVVNSQFIEQSSNIYFSFDLKNCHNCLWCNNLNWKEYYIFNTKVEKQEFENIVSKIMSWDHEMYQNAVNEFLKIKKNFIHRNLFMINSHNSIWDNTKNTKNSKFIFNASNIEDSMYLYDVLDAKNCLDLNYSLYNPEFSYNLISTLELKKSVCNVATHHSNNVFYCQMCNNCNDCFWCIWLNNKSYCIFNKQYSKEDYYKKMESILWNLIKDDKFWYFFDPSLSFHPYNDTFAMDYYPIKQKEENWEITVLNENWIWKITILEPEKFISKAILDLWWEQKIYTMWRTKDKEINIDNNIEKIEKLPNKLSEINDDILNKIIVCEKSKRPFRLIKWELDFYKKMWLPIPRLHYDIRHEERNKSLASRTLELWKCSKSGEKIIFSNKKDDKAQIYSQKSYEELF